MGGSRHLAGSEASSPVALARSALPARGRDRGPSNSISMTKIAGSKADWRPAELIRRNSTRQQETSPPVEIDRDELRDAALGHGDAEEPVHPRHGDRIVGDDDEAGVGRAAHLVQQVAEALDIVVVERRVDLVQHADRRRVGEEHREDQRQRGQRLLAARQQRQRLRLLAGRLGDDFEAGLQRIVAFDQLQFGRAAAEQLREQLA